MNPTQHIPVLADEILHWLDPRPGAVLVDGTLGGGGHSRLLAERVGPGGRVLALDRDLAALERAGETLSDLPVDLIHADYRDLPQVLPERALERVDGILLDLGLSSDQLSDASRGFSFSVGGDLDLRFDTSCGEPAWELLERLDAESLANLIYQYGEERLSRRIARRIVEARGARPIRTAEQLADIVRRCVPRSRNHRIHPATRTFQALRIAVNDELGALESILKSAISLLANGGRLAIISFHSLEDRLVKNAFRAEPDYLILTKKPIRPNEVEIARNPRSRSARLRVAARADASKSP